MKKLLRYNFLFAILFSITFLLSACGSQTTEEGGSVTIQSSPFSEIKTIAARVKAYLEIGGKTCEFELDPNDTTLKDNQKCTDIPMGSHSYKIVYKYTETGVILANTEGTITLISGKDNEIYLAPPEKDIDDDGDGFKNFYEILQGTDPNDSSSKPVEDKNPPAVSSTNPANNSTNIPVNSKISATFSEAIDSKTITNETFTVSNGSTNILGTVSINGTTATFTPSANLSYNTTYTATIGSGVKDLAGNTIAGNYSWSFTTEISSGTKPSAPTGVTAQAGDGQVTISWAAVSGATSYNIYWSTTASVSKTTGTMISNVKSPYNHTGITNGTTYRYVVTAVNSHGESGESDQTSATYTSVVTSDTTAPANITGTNFINSGASASNSTSVTLSISATDNVGVTGYYASENSATPSASDAGWTSITPTTSYLAGVTFTLSSGDGAKTVYVWFKDLVGNVSNMVSDSITMATTPTAPAGVTATAGNGQVTISWNGVSGAAAYNIYWDSSSGVAKTIGTKLSNANSPYTHTGLTNGITYYYVLTAVNSYGESIESSQVYATPFTVTPMVSVGGSHTVALRNDGTVWAWGYNGNGQLGDGTTTYRTTPVQVNGLTGVTAIATAHSHTVALRNDGTVWAWGVNSSGQLGDGTLIQRYTPVQVNGLTEVTAIAAGGGTFALRSDGNIWNITQSGPVQISGLTGITAIAAGNSHAVALRNDGTVWAWGNNLYGQLGDGTTTDRTNPVQVNSLTGVTAIEAGGYHTVALKSDGTVWTWGYNAMHQLGDGTTTDRYIPVQVSGLAGVASIASGAYHTVALSSDWTVWAWGFNSYGQLGYGTTTDRTTPVQVSSLSDVTAIYAGGNTTVALKSIGTVWAWGFNGSGQLGDGTTTDRYTPNEVLGSGGTGYLNLK